MNIDCAMCMAVGAAIWHSYAIFRQWYKQEKKWRRRMKNVR